MRVRAPRLILLSNVISFVLLIFLSVTSLIAATNMTPVSVTGFNRDVVVENTASGPPYNSYAQEFNLGEGTAFYQAGLPKQSYGLPVSGQFTNPADGSVFQFQPYTAKNVLVLYGGSNGSLTVTSPTKYSRIGIIANSGNGTSPASATLTLHFNDGTTFTTNYFAPDWFFNTANVALQGIDRINLSSGSSDGGSSGNPRFYQTTLDLFQLGAANKPLSSLTFGMPASTQSTGIYAVSGFKSSSVTPPAITNLPATGITAVAATLDGQVTADGGETPVVTIYYGPTDGGSTAGHWSNSITLGYQHEAFSQTIPVNPNTTYYFTASATNAAGIAWAVPSQSFTTPALTLPTVANLAASGVQASVATLNGQVVNSGGQIPTVTLYYGLSDGGANATEWSNSIVLGPQGGIFAQTVSGLSADTTYYFNSSASNAAGISFATPSQSFTTGATNSPWPFLAVSTQHNDNNRSGDNLNETTLNTFDVNSNQFGLLYARPVDDQIYAQPLVMTNVSVLGRGSRNLLIVATVNDTVYAFDADDPSVVAPYWTNSFIQPPNIVPPNHTDESAIGACGGNYQDFSGNFGIVGTPVIDPASGTIYLVARTKETSGGVTSFVQRLHALDATTGLDQSNSPVVITATYPGTGDGSTGSTLTLDPLRQNQRPALILVNGIVYITWTSHCDNSPYHGWVIGYNAETLQQTNVYVNTPNGSEGGIWMSGQGPCADTNGNLYISGGNGSVDATDYGESFEKLTPSGTTLNVASYFTPYNWSALDGGDLDLGSGGMLLIPGTKLAISGGKASVLYLVNRDKMGGLSGSTTADTNILQSWTLGGGEIHGGPVWWSSTNGSFIYVWADSSDVLRQYQLTNGLFNTSGYAFGSTIGGSGSPGGILSVSANGTNAGTGIIWAVVNSADANQSVVPGTLHAYNALNVSQELWNSDIMPARDSIGALAKFVPPTVANGKVYMATFGNQINIYGLFPPPPLSINSIAGNTIITWPTNTSPAYTLQSSTNLILGNWNPVTNSVVISNDAFQVTVPLSKSAMFYRLQL